MMTFIGEISAREDRVKKEKEKENIQIAPTKSPVSQTVKTPEPVESETQGQPVSIPAIPAPAKEVIVFKVQIGSFLNGKLTPAFKAKYARLSKFRNIDKYTDVKNYEIYTIGNFASYKDATLLKNQLIMEGVKGAFLCAFKNGERVPVNSVVKDLPVPK